MSVENLGARSDSARRFRKKTNARAMLGAVICTGAVGVLAAGYLFYGAYYSSGWHTHSEGTYYIYSDTGARAVGMQTINNTTYIFDDDGIMLTGWQEYNGNMYYTNSSGAVQKGRVTIDGEDYYFADDSGLFRTGLNDFNGYEYFFDDHGFPGNGFDMGETGEHYYDAEGKMVTGWASINGMLYYFKENGDMAKGLFEIDGATYYFSTDGHMLTGKQNVNGRDYDFGENGAVFKGWREEDGKYLYADEVTGAFVTGLKTIDGNTYYFGTDHYMVTGDVTIGDKKYRFEDNGVMTEGWYLDDNGNKYYFTKDGAAVGLTLIDDLYYYFNEDAVLLIEWYKDEATGKTYYFGKNGVVHEGFLQIEDDVFYLDPITHEAVSGWITLYDVPEERRESYDRFRADMELLDKYYASTSDSSITLTEDEQAKAWNLVYQYNSGYDKLAYSAYKDIGSNMFELLYFFDDYKMAKGPVNINGHLMFFDELTGIRGYGWNEFRGKKYYCGYAGVCVTGENYIDGKYYVFGQDGALLYGLVQDGNDLKYGLSDGNRVDIWLKNSFFEEEDGSKYYFDKDGKAVTGLIEVDGKAYVFGEDHKLLKDMVKAEGNLYYMTPNGGLSKRWVTAGNPNVGTYTYFFGEDGKAVKGWITINGVDFYFDKDCHMVDGLQKIDGKSYYFEKGGLVRGPKTIAGKKYVFSADGSMQKGWVVWNNVRYYCETEGIPLTGTTKEIDGKTYTFDANGAATEAAAAE
ncbi:MAG: hypothetical protein IJ561_03545 [Ruminococcus sp.]|nr:hypothetical protein [Ruminococcus sp.]